MPDYNTAGDLFRSRILGMGLEDTPYPQQAVGGMLGGATPEQLQNFFSHPQVQKQFQEFGIDPQQLTQNIRQSPFLPNRIMQQHPMLGGAFTGAMANMAATPAAPLVSGAGSGLSRAAQGMMGGNDMLRQFQLHQMMAPFGMMAGMMPTYGEERRRAIEEAIVKETGERMQQLPFQRQQQEGMLDVKRLQAQAAEDRARAAEEAATRPKVQFGPVGTGMATTQDIPGQPAGGPQGVDFQMQAPPQGQDRMVPSLAGGAPMPQPGWGLTPEQQAGWMTQYTPYDQAAMQGQFTAKAVGSQTPEKGALLKSQAGLADAKAGEARWKSSPSGRIAVELGKADAFFGRMIESIDTKYNPLITTVGPDSEQGKQFEQQRQNDIDAQVANYLVRIQHSGGQLQPDQQSWLQQYQQNAGRLPAQVNPAANKPTGTVNNRPGPQTSPTTATNPNVQW